MEIRTYKLFKTVNKTAKENGLVIAENNISTNKVLFDFSDLENTELSEEEKEVIKNDALKAVFPYSKNSFYGAQFDDFTSCLGTASYLAHCVYNEAGKRLYTIMQLAKIDHTRTERKTIFEEWKSTKKAYDFKYTEPVTDLEI